MIKLEALVGVVVFAVWVFALVEAIGTPAERVRHLPKVAWVLIVLFFPLAGSIAWFVAGRPTSPPPRPSAFPEYDRPGRMAAQDPTQDEAFLRQVRARAEEQRRRYDAERRRQQDDPPAEA